MTFPDPDTDEASAGMTLLRRLLSLSPVEVPMPVSPDDLHGLRDRLHQQIGFVMRAIDGVSAGDGSQTLATALTTIRATQNLADDLVSALGEARTQVQRAFPADVAARSARVPPVAVASTPSPDAGFSGFASPAGA